MKRAIKFRVWNHGKEKMEQIFGLSWIDKVNTEDEPEWRFANEIQEYLADGPLSGEIEYRKPDWVTNTGIHFMQSTGLIDKAGHEIYEGDIICHMGNPEWIYEVSMDELDYIKPMNDEADDHTGDMSPDALHARPSNFMIIGNIYLKPSSHRP